MLNISLLIGPNRLPINGRLIVQPDTPIERVERGLREGLRQVAKDPGRTKGDVLRAIKNTCDANCWTWLDPTPDITIDLCHIS